MVDEKNLLEKYCFSMSIPFDLNNINSLYSFLNCVLEKNKVLNLTSITNNDEFIQKHLIDSLSSLKYISDNSSVLDIGVGGGFPTFPLSFFKPSCSFTAVDSVGKKINFLKEVIVNFNIRNVNVINSRIEDLLNLREHFDYIVSRAVGHLGLLLELSIPFLKVGGKFIAYKSNESEIEIIKKEMILLDCIIETIDHFCLPNGDKRCLIIFKKIKKTNIIYPRKFSVIKKFPLCEV